jgi:hypothetical protein
VAVRYFWDDIYSFCAKLDLAGGAPIDDVFVGWIIAI